MKQINFHQKAKFDVSLRFCPPYQSGASEIGSEVLLEFEYGCFLFELFGSFGLFLVFLLQEGVLAFLLFKHLSNNLYILAIEYSLKVSSLKK